VVRVTATFALATVVPQFVDAVSPYDLSLSSSPVAVPERYR